MLQSPPELILPRFQQDYATLQHALDSDENIARHKDEILAIWYASPFIKQVCISQPAWLKNLLDHDALHADYTAEKYAEVLKPVFSQADNVAKLQRLLRQVRAAHFARIAWRDLQQYTTVRQTLNELSIYAQVCIDRVLAWCFDWLQSRSYASEFEQSLPQHVVVFALGKLGGHELNFSSDVDLIFAYSADVTHTQDQNAKAVSFYLKLVQLLIKVLAEQTQDGFVFRVDTRLRPFGYSGALMPSLSAIDQYFQIHGRDWERYAWIKARAIAGNVQLGEQFLKEVTPFIYRRYLDYGAVQSLREMKALVDQKARQNSAKADVKIGLGGIREIEFIVQMFQLIYGGRDASLCIRSTLMSLKYLGEHEMLANEKVTDLTSAYLFLRKAENGLQIRNDQQTHTLPIEDQAKVQYAYAMGAADWNEFYTEYIFHTSNVNKVFQSLLNADESTNKKSAERSNDFELLWQQVDDKQHCIEILSKHFTTDVEKICERLQVFAESGVAQRPVSLARQRLDGFMPIFLQHLLHTEKPTLVLERFIGILNKILQRSTYISLLTENQNKLTKLFKLIEVSPWIAQYLLTHPLLLDEILRMDDAYQPPSLNEMQQQLDVSVQSSSNDLEKYMERLREFKHAQVLQIAAADIVEAFPVMRVSDHLSGLAETCISSAADQAYKDLIAKYGEPICIKDEETFIPQILIIEYGKLGGLELGYGSDLDLVFVHNGIGTACETNGAKKLHGDIFFTRLVQRIIHLLSTATSAGKVFDVDVRLRPYGASGPLVTSISAYKNYLCNEAWLWEHQALIRARPVTNSSTLADNFAKIRQNILCQSRDIGEVRKLIMEMRGKISAEHGGKDKAKFNIKKDQGGLVDIEFIVQFHVLSYANKHNDICIYTDNVRILDACSKVKLISKETAEELKSIYLKYRKHLHQLSLQLLPETVDVGVFAKERLAIQNYWASLLH